MDIRNLLKLAAEKNASDLHILAHHSPILRVDGELYNINKIVLDGNFDNVSEHDLTNFVNTILDKDQKKRFFDKKDLDLSYQVDSYRFRLNFAFEKSNICIVARVIKEEEPTLEDLGMPIEIAELLEARQGLVLVTGPTGCGKSTTLAAMINHINTNKSANIITLEDPIEFVFKSKKSIISQRQLGTDMNSFSSGLKHVLRQDPNVIMLGEMRDLETISTAITIAETGHLVLATLHTFSAIQTIDRIIDIFPPHQQAQIKSQLSFVLSAVISQRLLPKIGGGRIAAREILFNNPAIANLIREGKIAQIKSSIETGANMGMITLDKHIRQLYQSGLIAEEVALGYVENPNILEG